MSELDPAVQREIEELGIVAEVLPCDPGLADTEVFCERYGIPRENAANTLVVALKTDPRRYVACLVLANTKIDANHKLSKATGVKRLTFASADETKTLTGQLIGGVTVFALPEGVPLYADERVMAADYIVVGGGNRSTKVKMAPAELRKLPRTVVADIAIPR